MDTTGCDGAGFALEAPQPFRLVNPPDRGIRGNSRMIMQDKNHLQIADLILQWISAEVGKK